jgi:predicted metal-binding membrane protein
MSSGPGTMPREYDGRDTRNVGGLPLIALALSTALWIGLFARAVSSTGTGLYTSSMSPGSTVGSMFTFLGGWEVMVVAMMLPASLSFLRLFRTVSRGDCHPAVRGTAVCLGYGLVWAAVGGIALTVSGTIYRLADLDLWLTGHSDLFAGFVLILAGAFQFTTIKRRCLAVCSHPGGFLMRRYRRGVGNAVDLGVRYGIACVGCCWALMALMVVLGAGSLFAMMVLSGIMFAERTFGRDNRFAVVVGLACVGLGTLVIASPGAVPALAHNAAMWTGMGLTGPPHGLLFWCHA